MRIPKAIADLVFSILLIACNVGCGSNSVHPSEGKVHIEKTDTGFTLIRNNEPFLIRGVAGDQNLALLKSIGGNTIRTYDTLGLTQILNEAQDNGLAVIAGLVLPKSREAWFYENDSLVDLYEHDLQKVISRYKDHPALLMWCLGNEPNFYDFSNFQFSSAYNRFLNTIRKEDRDHPVTTALANFSDREILNMRLKIPGLEVLMINTFGRLPELERDMAAYRLLWKGPFIVGEYGISGPWETNRTAWQAPLEPDESEKAKRLKEMYNTLPHDNPRFLGALAFYWGQRQEVTHTWFNFFSEEGEATESVYTLSRLWGGSLAINRPPKAENLQIDGSTAYNHFLFGSATVHSAQVALSDPDADSLEVEWSLRPEDWLFEKAGAPEPVDSSFLAYENGGAKVIFQTPGKPGPFRLFVKVTDGKGHFATTNFPFYVVR